MKTVAIFCLSLTGVALVGCSPKLDPAWLQDRPITYVRDGKKTFGVPEGMVFYDTSPPTRGIRFPPGVYAFEAEDAEYFYFRSSTPLDFRVFKDGKVSDEKLIPGGIMFAKHLSLVPAAGYIDGEGQKKFAVWKLGREFLAQKGKFWTANLE